MRVLLLGASGYLGRNVASRLEADGNEVVRAVRRGGRGEGGRRPPGALAFSGAEEIRAAMESARFDWVVNCAGAYGSARGDYPSVMRANLGFPGELLCLAAACGVPNFMTMGTSLPPSLGFYSLSKSCLSELGGFLGEAGDINFADLKLEMFYGGEGEPDSRFMRSCKLKLERGEPLLLTDGLQRRDIVRVEDVCSVVSLVVSSGLVRGYRALPVGSGESRPIRQLVTYMRDALRSSSEIEFGAVPRRCGEPDTLADVSWYGEIGFELRFDLARGLADYCVGPLFAG